MENSEKVIMKILVNEEDLKYIEEAIINGEVLREDLGRWFKEKWVDVSKKVKGKHPPCGRKKATDKGYPKCRPLKKVSKETPKTAGSYTSKEKKAMTSQKRKAEKTHSKSGTGNPPKMTHYNEGQVITLKMRNIVEEKQNNVGPILDFLLTENTTNISEGLMYHINNNIALTENVFRIYSEKYFNLINEARVLYNENKIHVFGDDIDLINSDLGQTGIYEGEKVYLDVPFMENGEEYLVEAKHRGKNVKLNHPFRTPGGPKKFAVYVKSPGGNVKKVTFGDPNLKIKSSNPKRAKSFRARHKCSQKKDRTTAGYWSCHVSRYRKALGLKSKRPW
jgi:Family of unknown function (DUF5872)